MNDEISLTGVRTATCKELQEKITSKNIETIRYNVALVITGVISA